MEKRRSKDPPPSLVPTTEVDDRREDLRSMAAAAELPTPDSLLRRVEWRVGTPDSVVAPLGDALRERPDDSLLRRPRSFGDTPSLEFRSARGMVATACGGKWGKAERRR